MASYDYSSCSSTTVQVKWGYELLRQTGVLKLPSKSTLQDYTNYIHPQACFNPEVVKELREQAEKVPENQRYVALLHDDMSIKEDLVFDSKTGFSQSQIQP